jgi:hypothetical protein
MQKSINIKLKLKSLLRRHEKFYCISYDWDSREIIVHRSEQDFVEDVRGLQRNGLVKRAECYLDEVFKASAKEDYLVYLISFGDFRKGKMVRGQNPLAYGLGVCLFDYVYIFIDGIDEVVRY